MRNITQRCTPTIISTRTAPIMNCTGSGGSGATFRSLGVGMAVSVSARWPLVDALRVAMRSGSVQYPSSPTTLIDAGAIGTQDCAAGGAFFTTLGEQYSSDSLAVSPVSLSDTRARAA